MTDITINTRLTWTPTKSGAEQWNKVMGAGYAEAFPGQPIACSLWEFMAALGPIVGVGSGAAMPATAIRIEVTKADEYRSILIDFNEGRISEVQAVELIVSVDPSIPQADLDRLMDGGLR